MRVSHVEVGVAPEVSEECIGVTQHYVMRVFRRVIPWFIICRDFTEDRRPSSSYLIQSISSQLPSDQAVWSPFCHTSTPHWRCWVRHKHLAHLLRVRFDPIYQLLHHSTSSWLWINLAFRKSQWFSVCPFWTPRCNAVTLSISWLLTSAPGFNKSFTIPGWFHARANYGGSLFFWSWRSASTSNVIKKLKKLKVPIYNSSKQWRSRVYIDLSHVYMRMSLLKQVSPFHAGLITRFLDKKLLLFDGQRKVRCRQWW